MTAAAATGDGWMDVADSCTTCGEDRVFPAARFSGHGRPYIQYVCVCGAVWTADA